MWGSSTTKENNQWIALRNTRCINMKITNGSRSRDHEKRPNNSGFIRVNAERRWLWTYLERLSVNSERKDAVLWRDSKT